MSIKGPNIWHTRLWKRQTAGSQTSKSTDLFNLKRSTQAPQGCVKKWRIACTLGRLRVWWPLCQNFRSWGSIKYIWSSWSQENEAFLLVKFWHWHYLGPLKPLPRYSGLFDMPPGDQSIYSNTSTSSPVVYISSVTRSIAAGSPHKWTSSAQSPVNAKLGFLILKIYN